MNNFKFLQTQPLIGRVDTLLKANGINVNYKIMLAVQPFTDYYIDCPVGFAETDNLNDISECIEHIREMNQLAVIPFIIKLETTRFANGRNAGAFGRYIGRLAYLINSNTI